MSNTGFDQDGIIPCDTHQCRGVATSCRHDVSLDRFQGMAIVLHVDEGKIECLGEQLGHGGIRKGHSAAKRDLPAVQFGPERICVLHQHPFFDLFESCCVDWQLTVD